MAHSPDYGEVPTEALQALQQWLAVSDLRAARLVCKHWAGELGAAVATLSLPPALWQGSLAPEAPSSDSDDSIQAAAAAFLGSASSDPDLAATAARWEQPPKLGRHVSVPAPNHMAAGAGSFPFHDLDTDWERDAARDSRSRDQQEKQRRQRLALEAQRRRRAREQEDERRLRVGQLLAAFPAARTARLVADPSRPVDPRTAADALARVAELRGVSALSLYRLQGDSSWEAALGALLSVAPRPGPGARGGDAFDDTGDEDGSDCDSWDWLGPQASGGPATPARAEAGGEERAVQALPPQQQWKRPHLAVRLAQLRLLDVSLPGPAGLAPLVRATRSGALGALRSLELSSTGAAKLRAEHLEALGALGGGIRKLRLSFRAAAGSWAAPLLLDPLAGLAGLEELHVEFTGIEELGHHILFSSAAPLAALPRLRRLALLRMNCLRACQDLEAAGQLREVELVGLEPLSEEFVRSLAGCSQITHLEAAPVVARAVPLLRTLSRLQHLAVQVHDPEAASARGAGDAAAAAAAAAPSPASGAAAGNANTAAAAAAAIASMRDLTYLSLSGPLALRGSDVFAAAAGCGRLREARLRVPLPDGTLGFSRFSKELKVLSLAPHNMRSDSIRVLPLELPPALEELEGEGLLFERALDSDRFAPPPLAPAATLRRLLLRAAAGAGAAGGGGPRGACDRLAPAPDLRSLLNLRDLEIWLRKTDRWPVDELAGAAQLRRVALRYLPDAPGAAAGALVGRGAYMVDSDDDDSDGEGGAGSGAGMVLVRAISGVYEEYDAAVASAVAGPARLIGRLARTVSGSLASLHTSLSGMLAPTASGALAGSTTGVGVHAGGRPSCSGAGAGAASHRGSHAGGRASSMGGLFAGYAAAAAAAAAAGGAEAPSQAAGAPPTQQLRQARDQGPFSRASLCPFASLSAPLQAQRSFSGPAPHPMPHGHPLLQVQQQHEAAAAAAAVATAAAASTSTAAPSGATAALPPPKGVAALGQLLGLEVLELEAEEQLLLGPSRDADRARRALRALPALRSVSICIHTERRASAMEGLGRELVSWLAPAPAGWQDLKVSVKGPGAAGGAQRLVERRLAEELPRCRFGEAA